MNQYSKCFIKFLFVITIAIILTTITCSENSENSTENKSKPNSLKFLSSPSEPQQENQKKKENPTYKLSKSFDAHYSLINSFLQLRNGKFLSASKDNFIKIWDTKTFAEEKALKGYHYGERDGNWDNLLEITRGEKSFLIASLDNDIVIFETSTWKILKKQEDAHMGLVNSLVELRSGKNAGKIASCGNDRKLKIWDISDINNNEEIRRNDIKLHLHQQLEISEEGSCGSLYEFSNGLLASSSYDKKIRLWSLNSNSLLNRFGDMYELYLTINDMAFNFYEIDKKVIYTTNSSHNFIGKVMESKEFFNNSEVLFKKISGHSKPISKIIDLGNGLFATGSRDGFVRFWDSEFSEISGSAFKSEDINGIITFQILDDGRIVTTGSNKISIWEPVNVNVPESVGVKIALALE